VTDNATPSGTSLVAELLLLWSQLDEEPEWRSMAETIVSRVGEAIGVYPQALGHIAGVAEAVVNGSAQLALVGDPSDAAFHAMTRRVGRVFVPSLVVAGGPLDDEAHPALMRDRVTVDGLPTAYVCRGYTCSVPTTDPDELERQLENQVKDGASDAVPRHT
jgi:uncharacterized protein YyaL (SSP411 family)